MNSRKILISIVGAFTILAALLSACQPKPPPLDTIDLGEILQLGTPYVIQSIAARYRLRRIPGSWVLIGSSEDDTSARGDEKPQSETRLPGFWIMGDEITNDDYMGCENTGVCTPPETNDSGPLSRYRNSAFLEYPVVGVDWFQADTFCRWIGGRLPTEAEWEKAARGMQGNIYPWGNEEPECSLLNMNGCQEEPGPVPVSSYPGGASPYNVNDMAGNVREWLFDWYAENAYQNLASFNPTGPQEGKLKVVRGGGFNDFPENLRTAARAGYPPETFHEDVGFRCLVQTPSYAPFCPPTYTPLCRDPKIPPPDEPCEPGVGITGEGEDATINNFGCPSNDVVTILFDTGGRSTNGWNATVGGESFICEPSPLGANLIACTGPAPTMGQFTDIILCVGGSPQIGATTQGASLTEQAGAILAKAAQSNPLLALQTLASNCPEGYVLDPETGACIRDSQDDCPPNWFLAAAVGCEPEDENSCPDGTKYNENTKECEPEEEDCPEGFYMTEKGTCEPDQNREGLCPPGYYFNRKTNCCQPLRGDNYQCPDGYYFDAKYQRCLPIDGNGCGFGFAYNGYDACDESPYERDEVPPPDGGCPDGTQPVIGAASETCQPEDGYFTETRLDPMQVVRNGDELNDDGSINTPDSPDQPDCSPNATFLAALDNCFENDEHGCPPNYYWHEKYQRCVPTNGPGSPCPRGYIYHPKLECCVPAPGFQGSHCFDVEPVSATAIIGDSGLQSQNFSTAGELYANTLFDEQLGLCDDDSTPDEEQPDCPPGMFTTANLPDCRYPDELEESQGQPGQPGTVPIGGFTANTCPPGYWNEKTGECEYQPPDCGPNAYFDYRLGICIPLQEDCCPIGYDYSPNLQRCAPVEYDDGKRKPGEPCPDGYEDVQGRCLLIGRTEGGGQCWTFRVNVPQCIGPCRVGYTYNEKTGRCEKPDPCANVNCSQYGSKDCPSDCCQVPPTGGCVPK